MNAKKILATVLALALLASLMSVFAISASAEEDVKVIPKVATHPTLDGVVSEGEWKNAYVETLDWASASAKYSEKKGNTPWAEIKTPAKVKVSVVWYMAPGEDPYFAQEATEDGIYYLFEVEDTSRPWYVGETIEASATDAVQVFLDPSNAKQSSKADAYCYTFVPVEAISGNGTAPIKDGGFWWEFWSYNGGELEPAYEPLAECAGSVDFTYNPDYPMPTGAPEDEGYFEALCNAREFATQNSYVVEGFISFLGMSYKDPADAETTLFLVNSFADAIGTQFGMGLGVLDYFYDEETTGTTEDKQMTVAGMVDFGSTWQDVDYPDSFSTWELGEEYVEKTEFTLESNYAEVGKEITATVKLDSTPEAISGLVLDLVYDKTALELVSTEEQIKASVQFPVETIGENTLVEVNTNYNDNAIRVQGVKFDGVTDPCQIMQVKFKVLTAIDKETFPAFSLIPSEIVAVEDLDILPANVTNTFVTILKGDVDGSSKVELSDAMKAFQHVAKKLVLEGDAFAAADIDNNNKIELSDAMKIFQCVAKKISVEDLQNG